MLSVVTYNIRFGKNLGGVLQWLLNNEFDLVCLQEFPKDSLEPFVKKISQKFPFDYKFATGFVRENREYGELTLFNKDKIKVIKDEVIKLGSSIAERRIHKDNQGRSSLATILEYENKKFVLVNSHLACLSFNGFRMKQIAKVLNEITEILPSKDTPVIFLGDFNYSSLTRRKKLIQYMHNHGFLNAYKKHTHRLFYMKHQLDYVFYKHSYIDNVDVEKLPYSDHSCITFFLRFVPKTQRKVIIFDFDGTIANTIPKDEEIARLFNKFAKEFGFENRVTVPDIKLYRSQSLRDVVKSLHIRFYRLPFILRKVQKFLHPDLLKSDPVSGMPDTVGKLRERGYTLGIITSSKKTLVENFLRRHNMKYFDFIHTGTSLFGKHRVINKVMKKYGFRHEDVIYVGDEIRDIEAVKKSEIPMIAVTWGFNTREGLQKYLPHFLAEEPSDILKILT